MVYTRLYKSGLRALTASLIVRVASSADSASDAVNRCDGSATNMKDRVDVYGCVSIAVVTASCESSTGLLLRASRRQVYCVYVRLHGPEYA